MTEAPPAAPAPDGSDPSMEDILASIRRILNEDESTAEMSGASGTAPPDDDVLVLDQSMMVSAVEPVPDAMEAESEAEPEAALEEPQVEMLAEPKAIVPPPDVEVPPLSPRADPFDLPAPTPELVAPEAAAAAALSVGSLVRTLTAGRGTQVYSGGPTLEDMVRAELRPLLKEWLDTNLPPVVERLVRTEIERVVGRAVP